jgi:hypothetical protein
MKYCLSYDRLNKRRNNATLRRFIIERLLIGNATQLEIVVETTITFVSNQDLDTWKTIFEGFPGMYYHIACISMINNKIEDDEHANTTLKEGFEKIIKEITEKKNQPKTKKKWLRDFNDFTTQKRLRS